MTFTKKKDQFFGPLSTTSESAFPRVPVSQYFGGHFWGHFWGTFGDNLGPQAQLGNQRHLQKKWNSFLDPQVLPQSLHFQSSAYWYVNIFGGTFRGAFVGTMGGTLGDNLGIQALHQSVFPIRMSNSRALFGGTFSRQIFEAIFGTIFQVYLVTILVTIFQ